MDWSRRNCFQKQEEIRFSNRHSYGINKRIRAILWSINWGQLLR